ncbi:FxSxx-COOH system tetratricopeptide repeat protein [Nocardiopsis sp. MG754419]|uniref:FxSxx-COOH system tetratricopeptide repeat protein n=1 Tax=Nocardiopsis sp. MG754419 TaxID=2259865 RepID=UPI001BA5F736|nr:FxSxx-COOH system tetratricopeptide repeat protein [Nocardiopsis sp. MG754419]MBR8740146.1 hypothetical protein [Nocardiopsis sp. MG754419]
MEKGTPEAAPIQHECEGTGSTGRILVFHAPLPGSSCTTSLANVAWTIASTGRSVLLVDFDLRTPELRDYFAPLFALHGERPHGLTDMITGIIEDSRRAGADPVRVCTRGTDLSDRIDPLSRWAVLPDVPQGAIGYLGPGAEDSDHRTRLNAILGTTFDTMPLARHFLRALRTRLLRTDYDHVLVDTAPGNGLLGRLCAELLADQVALCLSPNTAHVTKAVDIAAHLRAEAPHVRVRPVLTRVDQELPQLSSLMDATYARLSPYVQVPEDDPLSYWEWAEIPYRAVVAERHTLAAFLERPRMPTSLYRSYERLTALLTDGTVPRGRHLDRERSRRAARLYSRSRDGATTAVTLLAAPRDRVWADWVRAQLEWAGVRVDRPTTPDSPGMDHGIVMVLASAHLAGSAAREALRRTGERTAGGTDTAPRPRVLQVTVGEGAPALDLPDLERINLLIREEQDARQALLSRFDPSFKDHTLRGPGHGPRYPAGPPDPVRINNAPRASRSFSGREGYLEHIRDRLGHGMVDKPPVVLVGMPGSGKSEIVREYIRRFRFDYDLIWWIGADHPEQVEASLERLEHKLARAYPEQRFDELDTVLDTLRQGRPVNRWLLVFDDAGPPGDLDTLVPHDHGHVVITSYHREWETHGLEGCLRVGPFSEAESLDLLRTRLPDIPVDTALRLSARLGHLPALLQRALEWLSSPYREGDWDTIVGAYIGLLDERARSVTQGAGSFAERLSSSLALDDLEEHHPASLRLMRLVSHLAPVDIPEDLLRSPQAVEEYGAADPRYRSGQINFNSVHHQLTRVLLMSHDRRQRTFSVHPAIQEVVRDRVPEEERERIREATRLVLAGYAPHDEEAEDPRHDGRYAHLSRHVTASGADRGYHDDIRRWLVNQVRYHHRRGEYHTALELGSCLLHRWTARFGERDRLRLRLATQLANVHRANGEHLQAWRLNRTTLELQTEVLGARHPFTLLTRRGMSADLRAQGLFRKALECDQDIHADYLTERGPEYVHTLLAQHNLALSLSACGDYAGAATAAAQAFRTAADLLGEEHAYTWIFASAEATYTRRLGDHVLARRQLARAADMLGRVLGERSSHTLHALKELAAAERLVGEPDRALRRIQGAYELHRAEFRDRHPRSLAMVLELAACLASEGRWEQALLRAEECVTGHAEVFGDAHPFTHTARSNLATYAWRSEDPERAVREGRRAHRGLVENAQVGEDHPLALGAAVNLANALVAAGGRDTEVVALDLRAQSALRDRFGSEHPHAEIAYADYDLSTRAHRGEEGGERGHIELEVPEI